MKGDREQALLNVLRKQSYDDGTFFSDEEFVLTVTGQIGISKPTYYRYMNEFIQKGLVEKRTRGLFKVTKA
jgi:DNA-binding IclR family transcriptional regulator